MATISCSSSVPSTCSSSISNAAGESKSCNPETVLHVQVVHKRKERMTRRQQTQETREKHEKCTTTPTEEHIPLLASIPDDITIDHILTRVHWSLLNILTTLNLQWYHAIRSGKVHNARVRLQATQTLVIISHLSPAPLNIRAPPTAISAYDPTMDQWHLLPPIPSPGPDPEALPQLRGVVCLKGRLYIATGSVRSGIITKARSAAPRDQFFVLDFGAAARRWNKCRRSNNESSSASKRTYGAVSDVEDGKICVWGTVQI